MLLMKNFPKDFEKINGVWFPKGETDGINYSDGKAAEDYLLSSINKTTDLSSTSKELVCAIRDWPSRYHLEPTRGNLFRALSMRPGSRILELGSGCGAITRYLGEQDVKVTAVEGSHDRAKITRARCRDLENVEVVSGNFDDMSFEHRFDIVTLIGVLEYSHLFCRSEEIDPFTHVLRSAWNHLEDDGVLVIAIENKLGIKYFSGCGEDHLGKRFVGIEGYPDDEGAKTFGRQELIELVEKCNFIDFELLLPFPDYKIPTTLINAKSCSSENARKYNLADWCRQEYMDYVNPRLHLFQENLALKSLAENGLLADFSNSFLLIASKKPLTETSPILPVSWHAKKINVSRDPKFQVITTLNNGPTGPVVNKQAVVKNVERSTIDLKMVLNEEKPFVVNGHSLSQELLKAIRATRQPIEKYQSVVASWVDFLDSFSKQTETETETEIRLPEKYIDCIPENLIRDSSGKLNYIDDEWSWHEMVPINWVIFRGLYVFWLNYRVWIEKTIVPTIYTFGDFINISLQKTTVRLNESQLNTAAEFERKFQTSVSGKAFGLYYNELLNLQFDSSNGTATTINKPTVYLSKNHARIKANKSQLDKIGQETPLKIGILSLDYINHACSFIRVQSILQALTDKVLYRHIINTNKSPFEIDKAVIDWADVIIIQRVAPRQELQELIEKIIASNCCVIYEADDLLTEKLPESNFLAENFNRFTPYIVNLAKRADLITTSTQFLAKKLSHYNSNVQVLPNYLDQKLWQKKLPVVHQEIQTILYAGTQTHAEDLESIEPALLKIHELYKGKIKYIFLGCSTPELRALPGTEYYDLVPYREYSALIQKLSIDFAVIPLLEGTFNNCKSNIKWLEYSMTGIAGIYSDVLPYQGIVHKKTGLLVKNTEQNWFNALAWMIEHPEKRIEIALAAQQKVVDKYTLLSGAEQYYQTWLKLRQGKPKHQANSNAEILGQDNNLVTLQQLSLSSGIEAASELLQTISEVTGASITDITFSSTGDNSKFLKQYGISKDELFLHLAESLTNKAVENSEHDIKLLKQSLLLLSAIETQSVFFDKSLPLKSEIRQLIENMEFQVWTKNHMLLPIDGELFAERMMLKWHTRPSFHLLMLVFPGEEMLLANTLNSLGKQYYQEWGLTVISELPIPDPVFEEQEFLNWIQIQGSDNPFLILNNLILDIESDWVATLSPGITFEPQTFIQLADYINIKPEWKLIYTDEDVTESDDRGKTIRSDVKFKPDFNLDLLRSSPYIGNFVVAERISLIGVGGVSTDFGMEGVDTAFRIFDGYGEQSIGHISDVLVHQAKESGRLITDEQIQNTVLNHLQRNDIEAKVTAGYLPQTCRVIYQHPNEPKVSIIIPTKDKLEYLAPCVESLLEKTQYSNYEVIIVDNQSTDPDVFEYYDHLKKHHAEIIKVIDYPHAFNFSSICNFAADLSDGDYLLLLNNDTEILQEEWLARMMMHAMREDVGIVGARLVYPETGMIQHAGVIMGMGGIAEHPFIGQFHVKEAGYMGRIQLDQNYSAVTGACLLIEKKIYQSVQGMDEQQFAVSFNDVDLCLKVRKAGLRVVWTPYSTLVHHGNVTQNSDAVSKEKVNRFKKEKLAMFQKWQAFIAHDPAYNRNLSLTHRDFSIESVMPNNWDVNFHDRLRIFGIPLNGGSGDYRLIQPFEGLRQAGLAQCEYLRLYESTKDRIILSEIARQKPDVLVFHSSLTEHNLDLLEQCKNLLPEIFLIYLLDDLIDQVPEKSSAYRQMKRNFRDVKPRVRKALSFCNRAVVSTKPLADFCQGMIDDIVIVPNSLRKETWFGLQSSRRQGKKPRVGWAGAMQHRGDLELIADVVKQTASEVDWIFMGMCPDSIKPYIKEFHDPVAISDYPKALARLNLDLAIAPLENNSFNTAKSNLRLLEYGVLGWPVICSDVYPYKEAPVTRVENSTEAWVFAIRQALDEPEKLSAQGDFLRQWVIDNFTLEDKQQQWLDALSPDFMNATHRQKIATNAAIN